MAVTWGFRCALWGIVSSFLAAVLLNHCWSYPTHLALQITEGAVAVLFLISSLIAFHISTLRCSESHTLASLLLSYKWHQGEQLATPSILAKANRMWKHPREAQEDLIRELTRRHAKTEYGRKNRLGEIQSVEDLRKKHPLTTYDHVKGYIQRLADGEEGVFLDEKPVRFCVTSGTTGVGKKVPYAKFLFSGDTLSLTIERLSIYNGSSKPSPVQKRCLLYTHPRHSVTKAGYPVAPYTLYSPPVGHLIRTFEHPSPPEAFTISDEPTSAYIHMLFAIADANLGMLNAIFTTQLYRALNVLETNWREMLKDLSTGQINAEIPLDPDVRLSLQGYLRPDQARISQLRREFEKGFEGIVKRIWPHLVAVEGIDISGFRKKLQDGYVKGVPLASVKFGSTEAALFGINLWINEDQPRYILLPHMVVFEFIPEKLINEDQPQTFTLDEVKVGKKYEMVETTRTGLYRYRSGDIIQIVGFHEKCPVIRMQYRTGEYLNLASERTNMVSITAAVNATVKTWTGLEAVDWSCAESVTFDPSSTDLYYVLFMEVVDPGKGAAILTEEQTSKFDANLQLCHDMYRHFRKTAVLSQARVIPVRPGTFGELRGFIVSRTTSSINQYKTPRKLRTRELVEWIEQRVITQ